MAAWRDNFDGLGRLGSGATGIVWLARQRDLGREVAVKELAPALVGEPGARERLREEARLLARLDHPNCVKVYAYLEDTNSSAIVMEYVPGVALRTLTLPLTVEQSLGVLEGALSGLGAAHDMGLVHGDVKPENILVGADGVSKLVDFGLATAIGASHAPGTGSPAYASPEALAGAPVDARSDLYSAALVLYELLTGTAAPGGGQAVLAGLSSTALSDPVRALVAKSLSADVEARPQNAGAFLAELRQAAEAACGRDWRDRALLGALVAAALLGAGGALGVESAVATAARRRHRWRARAGSASGQAALATAGALAVHGVGAGADQRHRRRWRRGLTTSGVRAGVVGAGVVAAESVAATSKRRWSRAATLRGAESAAFLGVVTGHPWLTGGSAAIVLAGSLTAGVLLSEGGTAAHVAQPPPVVKAGGSPGVGPVSSTTLGPSSGPITETGGGSGGGTGSSGGGGGPATTTSLPATTTTTAGPAGSPITWTIQAELPGVFLQHATCVNILDCWAAGYQFTQAGQTADMYGTSDGGANWASQALPAGAFQLNSISCPNTSDCWAVDTMATTDGGQNWVSEADPPNAFLSAVSCPTSTECFAGGGNDMTTVTPAVFESTDGGSTWQLLALPVSPNSVGEISALDCPTATACTAVGTLYDPSSGKNSLLLVGTTDGGATWTPESAPSSLTSLQYEYFSTVSCATDTQCWIAGSGSSTPGTVSPLVIDTSNGGATWNAETVSTADASGFSSLSCPTTTECWAVGSGSAGAVAYVTQDGGSSWHEQYLPAIMRSSYAVGASVTCPNASACWVTGTVQQGLVGSSPQGTVIVAMTGTQLVAQRVPGGGVGAPAPVPTDPWMWGYGSLAAFVSLTAVRIAVRRRRRSVPA